MNTQQQVYPRRVKVQDVKVGYVVGNLGRVETVTPTPSGQYLVIEFRRVTPNGNLGVPNGNLTMLPTEEFEVSGDIPEITLKREPYDTRRGTAWTYSYTTPVDVDWRNQDGTTRPGPRAGEFISYGTGLTSLRDMLRHKYGRAVVIRQAW